MGSDADETLDEKIDRQADIHARFHSATTEFEHRSDALIETFDGLTPSARELDNKRRTLRYVLPPDVSPETRAEIEEALSAPRDVDPLRSLVADLIEIAADQPWRSRLILSVLENFNKPRREPIFNAAMLTSAVASFESFLARLAREYFATAPDSLHALPKEEQKEFSLQELQKMASVSDAVEIAIQRRVSKLSFGGLTEWTKFFKDRLKIDLLSFGATGATREIFERRHCIVHTDSLASERYVNITKNGEVGEGLSPSAEYVRSALDHLDLAGIQLVGAIWRKFVDDPEPVRVVVNDRAYEALRTERWHYADEMFQHLLEFPMQDAERLRTRVNRWLAVKGHAGLSTIEHEVETWDVEPLSDVFVLARACLLDDLDFAFPLLAKLFESGDVTANNLATWPLFTDIRADPRISAFSSELDAFLEEEAVDDDPGDFEEDQMIESDHSSSGAQSSDADVDSRRTDTEPDGDH